MRKLKIKFYVDREKFVNVGRRIARKHPFFIRLFYGSVDKYLLRISRSCGTYVRIPRRILVNLPAIHEQYNSNNLLKGIYSTILHETVHHLTIDENMDDDGLESMAFTIEDFMYPGTLPPHILLKYVKR